VICRNEPYALYNEGRINTDTAAPNTYIWLPGVSLSTRTVNSILLTSLLAGLLVLKAKYCCRMLEYSSLHFTVMCEIGMYRKCQMRGRVVFVYKKSSLGILLEHKQEASVHVSSSAICRICRPNCIASSTMHKTKQWSLLRLKIPHLVGYPHRPSHGNGVGCAVADNVLSTGLTLYLESLGWNQFSCIGVSVA